MTFEENRNAMRHLMANMPPDIGKVVLMYGHGIQIEAFVDPTHPPRSTPDPLGLRHIALRVDDIEKTVGELGCEAGPIMDDWVGEKFCFIADPDGNTVELHE